MSAREHGRHSLVAKRTIVSDQASRRATLSPDQPNHITSPVQCIVQDDMVGGRIATTRTTLSFRASTCSGCSEAYMDFPSTRAGSVIHGDTGLELRPYSVKASSETNNSNHRAQHRCHREGLLLVGWQPQTTHPLWSVTTRTLERAG